MDPSLGLHQAALNLRCGVSYRGPIIQDYLRSSPELCCGSVSYVSCCNPRLLGVSQRLEDMLVNSKIWLPST